MTTEARTFLFAFSQALDGRDEELLEWYQTAHIPELLEHPNVVAGTMYRVLTDTSGEFGKVLCAWEVSGDNPAALLSEFPSYAKTRPPSIDPAKFTAVVTKEQLSRITAEGPAPADKQYPQASNGLLIIFGEAIPGQEDEFMRWYREHHLQEVVQAPGIAAASRCEVAFATKNGLPAGVAVFEIEDDDVPAAVATIKTVPLTKSTTHDPARAVTVIAKRAGARQSKA